MKPIPKVAHNAAEEIDARIEERETDALWLEPTFPTFPMHRAIIEEISKLRTMGTRSAGWHHQNPAEHIEGTRMPTTVPQRRPRGLTRWQLAGIAIGYVAVTGIVFWFAVERESPPEPATTGIAPPAYSGKPLPVE